MPFAPDDDPALELDHSLQLLKKMREATEFRYAILPLAFTRAVMLVTRREPEQVVAKIVGKPPVNGRAHMEIMLTDSADEETLQHLRACQVKLIQAVFEYVYGGDAANCQIVSWTGGGANAQQTEVR